MTTHDDEMRLRRERHADKLRRVRAMNDLLRGVSDDYQRMKALADEYIALRK